MSDHSLAERALRAICPTPPTRVIVVAHLGEPAPKERPRFGQGRTYTARPTEAREHALAMLIRAALRGHQYRGNVGVACLFYRSSRQRVDADNLAKLALDAATLAGAWTDDSQVTAQAAWVELDRERPRTVIAIGDTTSTLDRTVVERKRRVG